MTIDDRVKAFTAAVDAFRAIQADRERALTEEASWKRCYEHTRVLCQTMMQERDQARTAVDVLTVGVERLTQDRDVARRALLAIHSVAPGQGDVCEGIAKHCETTLDAIGWPE